jgi:hypothetical protein
VGISEERVSVEWVREEGKENLEWAAVSKCLLSRG